ncbi:hypothetical protein [Spirillospora sp. NPDC047279]|uniref:hypothetical protein n=1 Tax=Spirillospora sp. NPDC047279 TaxID=3155478 RepID=UPI0033CFCCC2
MERPQVAQTQPTPTVSETYPTYGEYVPPRPVQTRAPRSTPRATVTPSRKPTRRPSAEARRCPRGWEDVPFLRRWCQRNGYSVR